jgi:hypothetical protein
MIRADLTIVVQYLLHATTTPQPKPRLAGPIFFVSTALLIINDGDVTSGQRCTYTPLSFGQQKHHAKPAQHDMLYMKHAQRGRFPTIMVGTFIAKSEMLGISGTQKAESVGPS